MPDAAPAIFLDWILGLEANAACVVDSGRLQILGRSPVLADLPMDDPWWENELVVMGEPGRTALALGMGAEPESLRLWLLVPLEGETPGSDLLLLLLLGSVPEALAPAQRLREALAERDSRHAINQPLTAITFLLENLLFACREGGLEVDYVSRKGHQLTEQLDRVRTLLREHRAMTPSSTI